MKAGVHSGRVPPKPPPRPSMMQKGMTYDDIFANWERAFGELSDEVRTLTDKAIAQEERIEQLEVDLSYSEKINKAFMDSAFRHHQGGGNERDLVNQFPNEWWQWLQDNNYLEDNGLTRIDDASEELERRIKLLTQSGSRTRESALLDARCRSLMRMIEHAEEH